MLHVPASKYEVIFNCDISRSQQKYYRNFRNDIVKYKNSLNVLTNYLSYTRMHGVNLLSTKRWKAFFFWKVYAKMLKRKGRKMVSFTSLCFRLNFQTFQKGLKHFKYKLS